MTETLYSENLKVVFKCPDTEDRAVSITVTIEIQTTTSPLHRKDLLVRLTDDKDPFFLYNLCLGEDDFQNLKTQQGLLVDFSAFPQRFIALLQHCHQEENKESPKFLLQFHLEHDLSSSYSSMSSTMGTLKVIETNPFKHLTHLSLNLLPGNDNDVKKYLASCLKVSLEKQRVLETRLASTERELSSKIEQTRQQLSSRTRELDQLRVESGGRSERLTANHARELNSEREKALKIQEEMQQRYDKERKELETTYQRNLHQKENRIHDFENINKDLTDRRYRAEATIREQKTKLGALDEEYRRCRGDLQQIRRENTSLEAERHTQDKSIQQLKTRVAVLEQELLDKEQLVARITSSLDASQQQKEQLDERRAEHQSQIRKQDSTIKTMSEEILKGNEIIKKLQGELRGYIAKVKLKNEVTTRQENVLREKEVAYEKTKRELEETEKNLKGSEEEVKKLKEQVEMTLNKLEESKNLLKTNENVINWLNKQLNERQLTTRRIPPPSNPPLQQHPHSLPSFDHNSYHPPIPNYSTPLGPTPQPPHVSATTPVTLLGSSAHNLPASKHNSPAEQPKISRSNNSPQIIYNPGKNDKENQSPNAPSKPNAIDPKYFSKQTEAIPIRSISPAEQLSSKPVPNQPALKPSSRLSQQVVNKASLPRPNVRFQPQHPPPAVSAYFTGAKAKPT